MTENEIVGWHHQLKEHEFEQTLGDSEEQRSQTCCSPWGCRVIHDGETEQQQCKRIMPCTYCHVLKKYGK